jgi:glycosyltransferase involved in cell wall biosynthesis
MASTNSETTSVIIPVRNGENTIGRALASLAYQTRRPDEVIIVDNGSRDRTIEVARLWERALPIKLISCKTPGSGAARNAGIARATSARIAFLDADDVWYPAKLEIQIKAMDELENSFSGAYMNYMSSAGRILGNNVRYRDSQQAHRALRAASAMPVPLSSVIVSRNAVDVVGPFDESFRRAQDFEWLTRMAAAYRLEVPSQLPLVGYVLSAGTSSEDSYLEQGLAADLVRRRVHGSGGTYEDFVLDKLISGKIPKRILAGQAYRRAGIHMGQHELLKGVFHLTLSICRDPIETLKKLSWQSAFTKVEKTSPEVARIFHEAAT